MSEDRSKPNLDDAFSDPNAPSVPPMPNLDDAFGDPNAPSMPPMPIMTNGPGGFWTTASEREKVGTLGGNPSGAGRSSDPEARGGSNWDFSQEMVAVMRELVSAVRTGGV